MGLKLVERSLVKDFANIPRADMLYDSQLDAIIASCSDDVQRMCVRKFAYGTYRDYCQSYNQDHFDPVPQWIWVDAFPIDTSKSTTIVWAPYELHDQASITLIPGTDYTTNSEDGYFVVRKASGVIQTILPLVLARPIFQYAPRGFRVDYTGGYQVSEPPDPTIVKPDPMDDYGVVQVPDGLKSIIARKISRDWRKAKSYYGWTEEERKELRPYVKKNKLLSAG